MQSTPIRELRLESRNNIFVMAALYASGRPVTPVRVRNMSRTGALVEAAALPSQGTVVRLCRATLCASATVMWVDEGKAGLQFETPIAIAEWLPQGKRGIGQQFVDELFHQKRLRRAQDPSAQVIVEQNASLADELLALRLSLERAAEELAIDPAVASRHGITLQAIDGVVQALARLVADAVIEETEVTAAASR